MRDRSSYPLGNPCRPGARGTRVALNITSPTSDTLLNECRDETAYAESHRDIGYGDRCDVAKSE